MFVYISFLLVLLNVSCLCVSRSRKSNCGNNPCDNSACEHNKTISSKRYRIAMHRIGIDRVAILIEVLRAIEFILINNINVNNLTPEIISKYHYSSQALVGKS